MKLVVGIDYSITAPGVVCFKTDDKFGFKSVNFLGMTETKKTSEFQNELVFYKKKDFRSEQERYDFISEKVLRFIKSNTEYGVDEVYVGIEGYAMGAKGLIFNIAEATGLMKHKLWTSGYSMRIYEPTAIKKYASGKGDSDKFYMGESFIHEDCEMKPQMDSNLKDYESPKADIVDAYWIAKLLLDELRIRHGVLMLKDLDVKKIEVFNATSKHYKENILCRDFIKNTEFVKIG